MELIRGKKLLKRIFTDHWDTFIREHPDMRPAIVKNVEKMLLCGTEAMGFHLYRCDSCGNEKRVPHTCKSRFCPSCGVKQTDVWIERYTTLFANCQYQHVIFHPPSEFRNYFAIGRTPYFNALYTAVNQTLKDWYTKKGYLPGIMDVLHTFGRDEKFTPHIHVLVSCGGLDTTHTRWIPCLYMPHAFLKSRFRSHFLTNIKHCWIQQKLDAIAPSISVLFTASHQRTIVTKLLTVIWYVHIGKTLSNAQFTVRYIGRYTKRPAIAESRIRSYDGQSVMFTYEDHESGDHVAHTLPARAFIGLIIRHIPDEHFRVIRYNGFYANRVRGTLLPKVFTILGQHYEQAKQKLTTLSSWWRKQIERFTKLDPLICPLCFVPLSLITIIGYKQIRIRMALAANRKNTSLCYNTS